MKTTIPECIMCDSTETKLWTLDGEGMAVVTYLCGEHAAPLRAIMDAAGIEPPKRQRRGKPVRMRTDPRRRRNAMEALDWTPPS